MYPVILILMFITLSHIINQLIQFLKHNNSTVIAFIQNVDSRIKQVFDKIKAALYLNISTGENIVIVFTSTTKIFHVPK